MKSSRLAPIAAEVVAAAQRKLPAELRPLALTVPVHYERLPAADVLAEGFEPDILGLFTGDAHGDSAESLNPSPPQILLYLENLWDFAEDDLEIFREEVRLTYLHELGHYLGWDEDELAQRAFRAVSIMKPPAPGSTDGAPPEAKADANYFLAVLARKAGDPRKAKVLVAKALAEKSDHAGARQLLAELAAERA